MRIRCEMKREPEGARQLDCWIRSARSASTSAWRAARSLMVLLLPVMTSCKIRPPTPYWIETHGQAVGVRIAGWSNGVLLVDGNHQLWTYPGHWSQPWLTQGTTRGLRMVTASKAVAYGVTNEDKLFRFTGNQWLSYKGAEGESISEIAVTDDDRLLLLVDGKLKELRSQNLEGLDCDSISGVAVTGGAANEAYVVDQNGALYLDAMGRCSPVPAPARLRRIAGRPDRLLAVGADGSIWRRRANTWARLPAPTKYRAGHTARETRADDIALSAYTTWLLDDEGSVFVLSDET